MLLLFQSSVAVELTLSLPFPTESFDTAAVELINLQEWFEGGGEDALKAQKKERKAGSGSSPKKSPKKKSAGASSSAMSGKGFKSAEYIKDSGSSSDEDKGGNKSGSGSGSGGGKSD